MKVHIPFPERISCTVDEACCATGLGRTKLYELIKHKLVTVTKIGGRTLVQVRSLILAVEPDARA
jgi:excisionase family DNA binding protein